RPAAGASPGPRLLTLRRADRTFRRPVPRVHTAPSSARSGGPVGFIKPTLPTVDPETWPGMDRLARIRALAPFWVENGFGTQRAVHLLYAIKCVAYAAGAIAVASWTTPGLGGFTEIGQWWTEPVFFQKAVIFTLLFEILGLGCGSGPLTLRINPPIGGVLYWLRPGTVRLPPFPSWVPLTKGTRRGVVD